MNPILSDIDCRIAVERLDEAQAAAARARFVADTKGRPVQRTFINQLTTFLATRGIPSRTNSTPTHAIREVTV